MRGVLLASLLCCSMLVSAAGAAACLNTPWSGLATYSKADDIWVENACAENTFEYYNKRDAAIPKADRPDF